MNQIGRETVTQQMVAAAARVHVSTVSLALRDDPRLPEATRRRVRSAAAQLGYESNPLISLLMSRVRRRDAGYRGILAYLHTAPRGTPRLSDHVHRNFLRGASQRAGELGYKVEEFFLSQLPRQGKRFASELRERNITGLVVEHTPAPSCPGRRLPFDLAPFASSSLGVPLAHPQLHYVANDQYMRPILAARELLGLGYRRLGLVLDLNFDSAMAHRCSAGFWAVQQYIPELTTIPTCQMKAGDRGALRRWLRLHKPDAILASHDHILPLLRALGWEVPERVGWVHLDWRPETKGAAGIYGNSEHSGAAAVELVVSQMHRGELGPPVRPMSHLVTGSWVPGNTVRCVGTALDMDTSFFADLLRA